MTKVKNQVRVITGNTAAAYGAMLCRPDVVASYPITPMSELVEQLSQFHADGILDAEMVEVEGEYCPSVLHRCIRWISPSSDRCAEYERTSRCFGVPTPKRFCIDRFEYPNQRGALPEVGMTWEDAQAKCASLGK